RVLAVPVTSPSPMRVDRVGYGAGTREHPRLPNLVRLWTGEAEDPAAEEPLAPGGSVVVLETQLDDMDPRFLSALAERLLREGALDVYRTPILMKKGRMGTLLSVVCRPADAEALGARILAQSTTLGLRVRAERRRELPRRLTAETTAFGTVRIKWADHGGRVVPSPEYEDLLRIAESTGLPLEEIRLRILRDLLPSAE
ncbi:MAG TPA: DUF111 family protein, partial [Candidatus Bipolaricaulis anaerobius]|nr:DUF111 family protein [Candidatus Bipolaricaulis anaerobius]